ncbi:hypothetical protein DCO58_04640 [Helicobacter saguini]|uniref:Uncharacterized protein n=1 Tax=Helicobacter saguini TaxID=1548018 RepID=A0A6L7DG06_9HELI|nr:hypothetical protein [Helicobacter saguini]MWV69318.1 hypothetical protein [Helicobacter saguini]
MQNLKKYKDSKVQIPRYSINFKINNDEFQALITLKETLYGMNKGNKLYSIELEKVTKL